MHRRSTEQGAFVGQSIPTGYMSPCRYGAPLLWSIMQRGSWGSDLGVSSVPTSPSSHLRPANSNVYIKVKIHVFARMLSAWLLSTDISHHVSSYSWRTADARCRLDPTQILCSSCLRFVVGQRQRRPTRAAETAVRQQRCSRVFSMPIPTKIIFHSVHQMLYMDCGHGRNKQT